MSRAIPVLLALAFVPGPRAHAVPTEIVFSQSSEAVEAYDYLEVLLRVQAPDVANPFTDVTVQGDFQTGDEAKIIVDGFCDSADGSVFRIRFMPRKAGRYVFNASYQQQGFERKHAGEFWARDAKRKGLVRVDPQYPWHFIWEGTGEHYFWNATTTYYLLGWQDENVIRNAIYRLDALKVNRLRVLLYGRHLEAWGEPVQNRRNLFSMLLNPWMAQRPRDPYNPGFDYTRFDVEHWRKYERLLSWAREKDVLVSVVFDISSQISVRPEPLSEDERRYFRYAVARLAAWSNVTWDLGNEHGKYRPADWAGQMGPLVKKWDPYDHLLSGHNTAYRREPWSDMVLIQKWRRPIYAHMLRMRDEQLKTDRIIPQINEEYGYEDHYPAWSPNYSKAGQSADACRRAAWEIAMAGCYQTTGETARRGTAYYPDTGGGWINGRGDHTMVMLHGYARMLDFFTSSEWWKMQPQNDLVDSPEAMCLAERGRQIVVYLPQGGSVEVKLGDGVYEATWFNPRDGYWVPIGVVRGSVWKSPESVGDTGDWVLLLARLSDPSPAGIPQGSTTER